MIYFSHIRAGLMASALFLTTALASPAMSATLPEISPRQIAQDIERVRSPQTGLEEFVAPSFDPFEEDHSMAGTASLRSVSNATTIDGQQVRGGALLDLTFYYNSASNDPYDTRGYADAVYLSGEYAPVTQRDNRILECNEQVQDVVYYHEDYYRPSLYVNLFRPYRHYRGHFGFGRGYGYDYGRGYRGYSSYGGSRGVRNYRRENDSDRRGVRNRRNTTDRIVDRAVDEARRRATPREERAATGRRLERTPAARNTTRDERRTNRNRTETRRGSRDGFIGGPRRLENTETRQSNNADRRTERRGATRTTTSRTERAPRVRNNSVATTAARRAASRAAAPRQAVQRQAAPTPARVTRKAAPARKAERAAPAPKRQRTEPSRPARAERAVNRSRANKTRNTPRRNTGRKGNSKLRLMGFLPMTSAWSRNVVRNVDVQCAREEMLSVHIPQERLDAARFDGLTVLVLDRTGAEVPVFIPPNYIEGFRQAVNGRVSPNVSYQEPVRSAPVTREPVYQQPRPYGVEQAPCPVGTTKQGDGTCLQGGSNTYGGYPTR